MPRLSTLENNPRRELAPYVAHGETHFERSARFNPKARFDGIAK